jgi:hypothetical protein
MVPGELERASANVHPLDVTDSRCLDCIDDEGVCRGAEEAVDLAGRCSLGTGIKGGDMAQIKQRISRTSGGSSVQRTLDWEQLRDNAKMFAWFAVATLVATAPRWIALLSISLSVTQAPMPAALEDFKSMWAPCKDPKNLFPAYSPGGQLYKSLATSNDFCTWMGASGFHMIALHVLFAVQGWGKGTWARTILLAGLLLHAAIVIATVGFPIQGHLALHRAGVGTGATFRDDAMMNQTKAVGRPAALQQADMSLKISVQVQLRATLWIVGFAFVAAWLLRRAGNASRSWSWRHLLYRAARWGVLGIILTAGYTYYDKICDSSSSLRSMHIIWPLLMAKVCTAALRFLLMHSLEDVSSEVIQIANCYMFTIDFATSMYVRVVGWGRVGPQSAVLGMPGLESTAVVSMTILTVEVVIFALQSWTNVLRCYTMHFKHIHAKTLGEILVSYELYQRQTELFYSNVLVAEFAEISVCVLLATYQLVAPIWNQYGTWAAYADYNDSRIWSVVATLCLRLGIQVTTRTLG